MEKTMNLVRLKKFLYTHPSLDSCYNRIIHRNRISDCSEFSPGYVNSDTDLVIEGFPRSGNTFFTYKIIMETSGALNIAHHFHTPTQFANALRYRVKSILLIRKPKDAITSYIVRFPDVAPALATDMYLKFHLEALRCIELEPNYFKVVKFENAIGGNDEYQKIYKNLDFDIELCDVDDEAIFSEIEKRSAMLNGGLKENMVARPSSDKDRQLYKTKVKEGLGLFAKKINSCNEVYSKIAYYI